MGRGLALFLALGLAGSAAAQNTLADQRARLAAARREAAAAATRAAALERQVGGERDAAVKARTQEAALAARVRRAEADLAAARARVAIVDALLAEQRAGLAEQQTPIARLLAALQSLASRPAVAMLAQPGSVDDLVHVRAALGSTLPVVRARTAGLRDELGRSRALVADAGVAAMSLANGRAALLRERTALAALALTHSARAGDLRRVALAESDRAIALGEQARDIVDTMASSDDARATLDQLATLPAPPFAGGASAALRAYRLPVRGRLLVGLGEISDAGVRSRGLTLAPAAAAAVVAPAAGRVVFARPFRSYGTIVILDHGAGWTTLVTGLATTPLRRGATVRAGAPLGRAAATDSAVTVELRRQGRPVDITALIA